MNPLISVITVCYNAASCIEKTILSVINQTYSNIEYIIIDGGSTDGTIDIVNKYKDRISVIVSEKDKGIYDAMNKGVTYATGEWVNFMNAGDTFYNSNVVTELFKDNIEEKYTVVFGDTNVITQYKEIFVNYGYKKMHKYMPSCHQSIFCRRYILMKYPFEWEKYKYAADFNLFYNLKQRNYLYKYIKVIVSNYDCKDGFTQRNKINLARDYINIKRYNKLYKIIALIIIRVRIFIKKMLCII